MERSNYALISALYASKTRGLYSDIYFPIIKYAIVKLYAESMTSDKYSDAEAVHNKIEELFFIKIPHVVIAKTVKKLALVNDGSIELQIFEEGNIFKIINARFDEEENTYEDRERKFNAHRQEIELEYQAFIKREGTCDEGVSFLDFISANMESILGYFENETEEQVEEKYTSMVFFLDYLHKNNEELYKVANQLFWSSVIVAFLQSDRPEVHDKERGCESEYYVDTAIAMGMLDLSTPENEASSKDVRDIILSSGGILKIHPATLEEIKTILASVAQNGAYPGTSIANACSRRGYEAHDIIKLQLNLGKAVEKAGMTVFPMTSVDCRREILNKYKGKDVLKKLADNRNSYVESYSQISTSDMFREAHDIFMDDYIRDRRQKSGKDNVYFLTTNTDLIEFCKQRHPDQNVMISTGKVILDLWMHNAKPAQVSSSVLTETMARCLDMHRSKVRHKLHEVARLFNKTKEDVAPEVYQECLKLLYRRARNVVNAVDVIPTEDPKAFMTKLQEAIKEDNAYFDAINSEMQSRNESLEAEVSKQTEKAQTLAEESERKSQYIGSLTTKNETLTEEKTQLIHDLHSTKDELKSEKETSVEERKAKQLAQFKNQIFEKREALENKREELEKELKPWKQKRLESFKNKELTKILIVDAVFMSPGLILSFFFKEEAKEYLEGPMMWWIAVPFAIVFTAFLMWYSSEKRRDARREAAYAKWEAKPENSEYTRLVKEIAAIDEEITTCKGILKNPTSYMEMGN